MLCKVESINECDDIPIDDMDKDRLDSQVRELLPFCFQGNTYIL